MRCTGELCERKMDCARYYINARPDGQAHTIESLYSFGSGSISSEGKVEVNLLCSPLGDWGMFIPIERTNADRIRAMTDDDELALCLVRNVKCTGCNAEHCDEEFCLNFMKGWLKQPTE